MQPGDAGGEIMVKKAPYFANYVGQNVKFQFPSVVFAPYQDKILRDWRGSFHHSISSSANEKLTILGTSFTVLSSSSQCLVQPCHFYLFQTLFVALAFLLFLRRS